MLDEPLIFERGSPGRVGWPLPATAGEGIAELPAHLRREDDLAGMPEVSELEALRHFLRLSQWNYSAATTLYPLGSCTMKYNPVVNEELARLPGFEALHPLVPEGLAQGALELLAALEAALAAVSGLDAVCLQPAAGAHGELLGMLVVRAYHVDRGDARRRVLIPSSAHGTNPASATLCGYAVSEVAADERGLLTAAAVSAAMDESVAALMITNPNTLGLFEREIEGITAAVHARGGLVYLDGANLNAIMGIAKPAHMGVDVMQFNLHKTFSTPHGGGGPGAGPVAVRGLPAGAPARAPRRRARMDGRRAQERGTPAGVLRQLRHPGARLCVPRPPRRPGPGGRHAPRRPERQLPARAPARGLPPPVRHALAARVRLLRPQPPGLRRPHARRRQAPPRLRLLRAHHLLPAGGEGRAHDRADRDRDQGDARPVRRRAARDRGGGAQ